MTQCLGPLEPARGLIFRAGGWQLKTQNSDLITIDFSALCFSTPQADAADAGDLWGDGPLFDGSEDRLGIFDDGAAENVEPEIEQHRRCLLYTSPSPRDLN